MPLLQNPDAEWDRLAENFELGGGVAMVKPKIVLASVLAVLMVVLVIQNTEVVAIKFLFWEFAMSRVILILLATMTGFVCGYVVARITGTRPRDTVQG